MSVRTVTLTVDAYAALAAAKQDGESFSAVVRRLTGSNLRLSDFAGAWKGVPPSKLRAVHRYLDLMDRQSERDLAALSVRRRRRARGQPRQ